MKELAVLVLSCDKYSDLWNPFLTLFFKYWPEVSFPVYFCSDTKLPADPRVKGIAPGELKEWSARLLWALKQIEEPYILLLLDDYFLTRKVDEKRMDHCVEIIKKTDAAYFRLYPCPPPDELLEGFPGVGIISKGSRYRTSTQATIWNKEDLKKIIDPNESVWDFEIIGSKRSNELSKLFLCLELDKKSKDLTKGDYPYNYYCTAVYKGKWMRDAIALCQKENIQVDLNYRKVESKWDEFRRILYPKSPLLIQHILDFINKRVNNLSSLETTNKHCPK